MVSLYEKNLLKNKFFSYEWKKKKVGCKMISKSSFGITGNGEEAFLYTLTSEKGMIMKVTNYGATLCALYMPDRDLNFRDVVLGYDDVNGYDKRTGTYFGVTLGQIANYASDNFSHRLWKEKKFTDDSVTFQLHSLVGDQGFPRAVDIDLTYILNDNKIAIIHTVKAEEETFFNITNHSYFNLNGHDSSDILEHLMWINADEYLETNEEMIPTGKIIGVEDTQMDFRKYKRVGEIIHNKYETLITGNGYDCNWVLNKKNDFDKVAMLHSEKSGITMEIFTDMPGMRINVGNAIKNEMGKQGVVYGKNQGVCFQTQYFPNAVNEPEFEIAKLDADKRFSSVTVFKFTVQ